MNGNAAALLRDLPDLAFGYMLVVARVGSAVLAGPALGESEIPPTVRAALAMLFAVLTFPLLRHALPPVPDSLVALALLLVGEVAVGLWLGLLARILAAALAVAGSVVSFMVGLSSVLQIDPALGVQVPALQRFFSLAAVALLFATGLYILPVQAVLGSYDILPPGRMVDPAGAADMFTRVVGASFGLAARLAAPFVVACIVWQATIGLISRTVPGIPVHLVSAPAQILGGLALLAVAVGAVFGTWSAELRTALSSLPGL